jgi:ABC-type multidrug transport system fused ATPase/permease subunit
MPLQTEYDFTSGALIRDLWRRIGPYRLRFIAASLVRAVGDIAWLYPSLALAVLITELSKGAEASVEVIIMTMFFWGIAVVVRALSQMYSRLLGYWVSERVAIDTTTSALKHLMTLDMAWHEREGSGNKIKRIQNAALGMDRIIRMWLNMLIEIGINIVGIMYILSTIDVTLMIPTGIFIITFFPLSYLLQHRAAEASLAVNKSEEVLSGALYETAANIRTIKILSVIEVLVGRVSESALDMFKKIVVRIERYQLKNFLQMLWAQAFHIGTLMFIAFGIVHGHYEVGIFVLFHRFFGQLWESVRELAEFSQEFTNWKLAIARLHMILETQPAIPDTSDIGFPQNWKEIHFEHVTFSYGEVAALTDISLTIKNGEKIGVIGLSGAGKSTLFKLLLRERDDYEGEIYIDDVPLRSISRSAYFAQVSAVLQDTEVFNLSLKENILIAGGPANDHAFKHAIETAHVSDFVKSLPLGVDTVIGEKGVKLSGGERQRLGIARAIYKRPQILLMDEATSHLDSESEGKIQESLSTFFEQVTAIVIAHRLSTIKAMDRIIVIEGGVIVEEGSFEVLLAKQGRFKELWDKQGV